MSEREIWAYVLMAALVLAISYGWLRWRREVRRDRMMRWGTPHRPHRQKRRGQA